MQVYIFAKHKKSNGDTKKNGKTYIVVEKFEESEYLFSNGLVKLFC